MPALHVGRAHAASAGAAAREPTPRQQPRILLVEDNPGDARLFREFLSEGADEFELLHLSRLEDAQDRLRHLAVTCVVLDLSLPDSEGLGGVRRIRTQAPEVPLVVLTGFDEEALALEAMRYGADDYLVKGRLDGHALRRAIRLSIERRGVQADMTHQALYDSVTGLPSRLLFLDRTALALRRRGRSDVTCAVLFLDLDGFKSVNDSFGHAAGDELLRAVGSRLQTVIRPADTVARLGGDEFTILCEDIGEEENVLLLAERVADAIASPFPFESAEIHLTASIGLALAGGDQDSPDALLRAADAAMYQAKEAGARYELYDESVRARVIERAETQNALHRAIELEQFCLRYQPCVQLSSGSVIGAEALLRWEHPERGMLDPCEFIPLAEETSLIVPIGNWALEHACQELARWRRADPRADPLMLINLSPRQLADRDFPRLVAERLDEAQVARSSVCLEITESAFLDLDDITGALRSLKDLGVLIGIDDFGTGYSSLAHLKQLPADVVKIDRSFVAGLGHDGRDTAIVAAILELARALGIRAIAEGVETPEQVVELDKLGCELAQGYFFDPPRPGGEVQPMLAESRRAA